MPSLTVENYLKSILQLTGQDSRQSVSTGQLAQTLSVSPGTVTSMLKTLDESGLATHRPYAGVSLTPAGRQLAVRVLRRHRLIELFLVRTLSLTWDQVHEEAEHMEHAMSDFVVDRIDAFLGFPATDPHGDPIPQADGSLRAQNRDCEPLVECDAGARVCIVRVLNQQSDFLRYLSDAGLELGARIVVEENSARGGTMSLRIGDAMFTLGHTAAAQLLVRQMSSLEAVQEATVDA